MINNTEIFSIQDLSLKLGNKIILDNINFSMIKGKILTIIGPNGGGKTSLAKLIAGILLPSKGKIIFQNKIKIGYVPQKINIEKTLPLTVKNFIEIFSGQLFADVQEKLPFKINSAKDNMINNLSGGELQRVILAATILKKPDLMILDEPIKGLDAHGQIEFYELIEKINFEEKISILMISHDLYKVMLRTDQVICLNCHICCQGSAENVISSPEFAKLFGNKNNMGIYNHQHNHLHEGNFG